VNKDDIVKIAKEKSLPLGTIEKKFVLTYILKMIYESDLKDRLIFKRGNSFA
jgi:predicted nucleotidyltransferase component of viral defense system